MSEYTVIQFSKKNFILDSEVIDVDSVFQD